MKILTNWVLKYSLYCQDYTGIYNIIFYEIIDGEEVIYVFELLIPNLRIVDERNVYKQEWVDDLKKHFK